LSPRRFVWDPEKNRANLQKHGLHFSDAARIFRGRVLLALDDRDDYGEERWVGLGQLDERVVSIVFTEPDVDIIRVISLRKATSRERARYYRYIADRLGEG
jgi:uncharacterized DUF497 family protein